MESTRDWKRPLSWGIAGFLFFSIMARTPTVNLYSTIDVLTVSIIFGIFFALIIGAIGAIRTALTMKPSGILIPFHSLPSGRSKQAISLWMLGIILKLALVYLGAIGVVSMLVVAFAMLQRLWPDHLKSSAIEQE